MRLRIEYQGRQRETLKTASFEQARYGTCGHLNLMLDANHARIILIDSLSVPNLDAACASSFLYNRTPAEVFPISTHLRGSKVSTICPLSLEAAL